MGVGWLTPRPGRFTPGKGTRYLLYMGLGGPQGRKISSPPVLIFFSEFLLLFFLYTFSVLVSLSWLCWLVPLYCTTHNTYIHATDGIRTRNSNKRAATIGNRSPDREHVESSYTDYDIPAHNSKVRQTQTYLVPLCNKHMETFFVVRKTKLQHHAIWVDNVQEFYRWQSRRWSRGVGEGCCYAIGGSDKRSCCYM